MMQKTRQKIERFKIGVKMDFGWFLEPNVIQIGTKICSTIKKSSFEIVLPIVKFKNKSTMGLWSLKCFMIRLKLSVSYFCFWGLFPKGRFFCARESLKASTSFVSCTESLICEISLSGEWGYFVAHHKCTHTRTALGCSPIRIWVVLVRRLLMMFKHERINCTC